MLTLIIGDDELQMINSWVQLNVQNLESLMPPNLMDLRYSKIVPFKGFDLKCILNFSVTCNNWRTAASDWSCNCYITRPFLYFACIYTTIITFTYRILLIIQLKLIQLYTDKMKDSIVTYNWFTGLLLSSRFKGSSLGATRDGVNFFEPEEVAWCCVADILGSFEPATIPPY